jgi:hypothetical protein
MAGTSPAMTIRGCAASATKKATNKGGLISIKSPDPSVLARRDRDDAIARANDGDSMNQL